MKIALLTDGVPPFVVGGMQKHSANLARFLLLAGVDVTLVHCATSGAVPSDAEVVKNLEIEDSSKLTVVGLKFPSMGSLPGHYLRESYAYSATIYNHFKDQWNDFDLIYAKGFCAWSLINRKRKGENLPPIAVKFHGYEMYQPIPGLKDRFSRWLLKGPVKFNNVNADYVFSYGGKITEIITSLGVKTERVIEVPTGIAADWCRDQVAQTVDQARRFVFIGRYERRKGVEELTAVLESLEKDLDFQFEFIGPIPYGKRIKDERITYHGQVKDREKIRSILDTSDVLVTPSHAEGMPNVIMEGMARGLAVLATDTGAVSAMVNEANGWLIEPAHTNSLHKAFLAALKLDATALRAKKEASLERVKEQFTWERVAQQTLDSFQNIIGKRE